MPLSPYCVVPNRSISGCTKPPRLSIQERSDVSDIVPGPSRSPLVWHRGYGDAGPDGLLSMHEFRGENSLMCVGESGLLGAVKSAQYKGA